MSELQLRYVIDEVEQVVSLTDEVTAELHVGRGSDNDIVLPDVSVSRRHAVFRREAGRWNVVDLDSTNGVQINKMKVARGRLEPGDEITIGIFDLRVEAPRAAEQAALEDSAMVNATIVRKLSDFSAVLGLEQDLPALEEPVDREPVETASSRDAASGQFFGYLNRLARDLIHADTTEEVLRRVMEIAFEALPVDRGFILLGSRIEDVRCELMRIGDEVEVRPEGEPPVSHTILRTVMEEEVGLLTLDALDDQRLAGGVSIKIHGIRAAMCAPLWASSRINGFIQVDTPFHAGSFTEHDLDFLITLANYAAVGVQKLQEQRVRGRLERYHSPTVLDAVLAEEADSASAGESRLRNAEVTVLFADLVGFTTFSSVSALDQVAELLTGYCARSVKAIFDEGGTLDKYIGDCVMAFFGAPMKQADHAVRGCQAALRIQAAMDEWNADRRRDGLPEVRCRIAINSGPVLVGDVGSEQRVDYTVLGNTVNVAARLESTVAKPGEITIGENTKKLLEQQGGELPVEPLGQFALKGLHDEVTAYRIVRHAELGTTKLKPGAGA